MNRLVIVAALLLSCSAVADQKKQSTSPASSMPRELALEAALTTTRSTNLALQVAALQRQIGQANAEVRAEMAARDKVLRDYQIDPAEYGNSVIVDLKACVKGSCPIKRAK